MQHPESLEQTNSNLNFMDLDAGPIDQSKRQCRDLPCLIIFFANLGFMIFISAQAYYQGTPSQMFRGIVEDQTVCGQIGEQIQAYPYVYFYNPIQSLEKRVCISQCPSYQNGVLSKIQCYPSHQLSCVYDLQISADGNQIRSNNPLEDMGNFVGYPTHVALDKICIPSPAVLQNAFSRIAEPLSKKLKNGTFANIAEDLKNNWEWLICGVAITVFCSQFFMLFVRGLFGFNNWESIFGKLLLIVIMFMVILPFIAMGLILFYNGGLIGNKDDGFLGLPVKSDSEAYTILGAISLTIAVLLLVITPFFYQRLKRAVIFVQATNYSLKKISQILVIPFIFSLLQVLVWVVCLIVLVYLISAVPFEPEKNPDGTLNILTSVKDYSNIKMIRVYYFIFATLWSNSFIQTMVTFLICSSCCLFYFKHSILTASQQAPVSRSFVRALRYHIGSLALGSFIIMIVKFFEVLIEIFKTNQTSQKGNSCADCLNNCLRCCLGCVEKIVKNANQSAYIQIALRGQNFCTSSRDGFQLFWSDHSRYISVSSTGFVISFFGKIIISVGSTTFFYMLITFDLDIQAGIIEPLYLVLIVFFISLSMASLFIQIYTVPMDTLLMCYIIDEMIQHAKGQKGVLNSPVEFLEALEMREE